MIEVLCALGHLDRRRVGAPRLPGLLHRRRRHDVAHDLDGHVEDPPEPVGFGLDTAPGPLEQRQRAALGLGHERGSIGAVACHQRRDLGLRSDPGLGGAAHVPPQLSVAYGEPPGNRRLGLGSRCRIRDRGLAGDQGQKQKRFDHEDLQSEGESRARLVNFPHRQLYPWRRPCVSQTFADVWLPEASRREARATPERAPPMARAVP